MKYCKQFKSASENQKSFRVTSKTLTTLYNKARKVKKKALLVISIPGDSKYRFVLNCEVTKERM